MINFEKLDALPGYTLPFTIQLLLAFWAGAARVPTQPQALDHYNKAKDLLEKVADNNYPNTNLRTVALAAIRLHLQFAAAYDKEGSNLSLTPKALVDHQKMLGKLEDILNGTPEYVEEYLRSSDGPDQEIAVDSHFFDLRYKK